jgi:hypothetical protein
MSNKVLLKKSSVAAKVPLTTDLDYGELALNYADGKLYFKNSSNAINFLGSSSATETLTNKTLTSPTISNPIITGTAKIDVLRYANSNVQRFSQIYNGGASGQGTGYFDTGEFQPFLTVTPAGNSDNHSVIGRIAVQSGSAFQIINFTAALRSNTLPSLSWVCTYSQEFNGTGGSELVTPFIWVNQTGTGTPQFILGVSANNTIYGTVSVDADCITRYGGNYTAEVFNTVNPSEITSIPANFTSYAFTKLYTSDSGVVNYTGTPQVNGVAIPTISSTSTLTNKTLTSPTINSGALSGTFSGAATLSGAITLSNTTASTSTSTGALTVGGGLGVAGSIYADQIKLTNNGNGTNVYIGDDVMLGDINSANTLGIRGIQDATKGYIVFGNSNGTAYIGRDGTNPITVYGGQFAISGSVNNGGAALQLNGYASKGGTGYHDFLSVTNTYGSATNSNKFFRLNSTGQLEIVNSAYSSVIMSLTDAGVLNTPQISTGGLTLTGPLTTSGNAGANGYVLVSAGVGAAPQWQANTSGSLDGLTDVTITSPTAQQVLKYNGSIWQNADPDVSIASAVFATNAQSDLGSVTDLVIGTSENLGLVTEVAAYIYNMGTLVVDGIVSLNNIDQSIKADYIAYSIIFGF